MIMKHISIVLLAGLAAVAFCRTKETTPEQTAPEPQEMGVGGDIVCIDGTLHFSSGEVCLNHFGIAYFGRISARFRESA